MVIIRPERRKKGCIGTKAPNGCESSGAKHSRARMFLTWYQVNARHPRAESLLEKNRKNSGTYFYFVVVKYGDNMEGNNKVNKTNGPGN